MLSFVVFFFLCCSYLICKFVQRVNKYDWMLFSVMAWHFVLGLRRLNWGQRDGLLMRNLLWSMQNPEKKSWVALPSSLSRVNSAHALIVDGLQWPRFLAGMMEQRWSWAQGLGSHPLCTQGHSTSWHWHVILTLWRFNKPSDWN